MSLNLKIGSLLIRTLAKPFAVGYRNRQLAVLLTKENRGESKMLQSSMSGFESRASLTRAHRMETEACNLDTALPLRRVCTGLTCAYAWVSFRILLL